MGILLTVTSKGQVTLRKQVLEHLGLRPGDRVEVDLVAPGRVELHRQEPKGTLEEFFNCLPAPGVRVTIEEMNEAIEQGWSRS